MFETLMKIGLFAQIGGNVGDFLMIVVAPIALIIGLCLFRKKKE